MKGLERDFEVVFTMWLQRAVTASGPRNLAV